MYNNIPFSYTLRYSDDLEDRKECDCLNDCEMVHFFSSMQREPFSDRSKESRPQNWFDKGNENGNASGILANYLMDPQNIFNSQLAKNITKLANNLSSDEELAEKRFQEVSSNNYQLISRNFLSKIFSKKIIIFFSGFAILNFFFDTPIITEITVELRTNVFDMISAIGGTLGLFTGISVITIGNKKKILISNMP